MFLACAVAAAFMVPRPVLDRVLLVASAIPIALVANVSRITATGLLHETVGKGVSDVVYHDLAGWLMMFLTLCILALESHLLPRLFIETNGARVDAVEPVGEMPVDCNRSVPTRRIATRCPNPGGGDDSDFVGDHARAMDQSLGGFAQLRGGCRATRRISPDGRRMAGLGRANRSVGTRTVRDSMVALCGRYRNTRTGTIIDLLVVCGRPGPVSVHTPDICYPGAGYEPTQSQPETVTFQLGTATASGEFFTADFEKPGSFPRQAIRVYWSWSSAGQWTIPPNPRLAFAGRSFVYKLYLILPETREVDAPTHGAIVRFCRSVFPEVQKSLFPEGSTAR